MQCKRLLIDSDTSLYGGYVITEQTLKAIYNFHFKFLAFKKIKSQCRNKFIKHVPCIEKQ
jgi:hypothetical protein